MIGDGVLGERGEGKGVGRGKRRKTKLKNTEKCRPSMDKLVNSRKKTQTENHSFNLRHSFDVTPLGPFFP